MNTQILLTSLKEQNINLDLLIEVLETQKRAIVQNDYTALEKALSSEQKILGRVEKEENTRLKIVKEIAGQFSVELKENSLDNLMKAFKTNPNINKHFSTGLAELEEVRSSIKEKLILLSRKNSQLKGLIEFSRSMIKETIMMLVGPNKRALVNKRV
ncbi:MAG: flagellar export chaperone FlgN [Bacteroidota bacterium]